MAIVWAWEKEWGTPVHSRDCLYSILSMVNNTLSYKKKLATYPYCNYKFIKILGWSMRLCLFHSSNLSPSQFTISISKCSLLTLVSCN